MLLCGCAGSIPLELGALSKLETMFVSDNALEGEDVKDQQWVCVLLDLPALRHSNETG